MDEEVYGDGMTNTYNMAGKTFIGQSGTPIVRHPAAEYCAAVQYNHPLLALGKWFMPTIRQVTDIVRDIRYGTTNNRQADPINRALYLIGGTAISNGSGVWSCSRYLAYNAWFSLGNGGFAGSYVFNNSSLAVPCTLLDISEATN